jgi:hypothetical protein
MQAENQTEPQQARTAATPPRRALMIRHRNGLLRLA